MTFIETLTLMIMVLFSLRLSDGRARQGGNDHFGQNDSGLGLNPRITTLCLWMTWDKVLNFNELLFRHC